LPAAAAAGTVNLARQNINLIKTQTSSDWSDNSQVGFDLENWHNLISDIEPIEGGQGFGILNVQKMGTAEDFEQIAEPRNSRNRPGMWHVGTGRYESFRQLVWDRPDVSAEVARLRSAAWAGKEPQWWLLNYGNLGMSGAFDPRPGTFSIESVAYGWGSADIDSVVSSAVNDRLRRLGII
jgi:hypothetical protein